MRRETHESSRLQPCAVRRAQGLRDRSTASHGARTGGATALLVTARGAAGVAHCCLAARGGLLNADHAPCTATPARRTVFQYPHPGGRRTGLLRSCCCVAGKQAQHAIPSCRARAARKDFPIRITVTARRSLAPRGLLPRAGARRLALAHSPHTAHEPFAPHTTARHNISS